MSETPLSNCHHIKIGPMPGHEDEISRGMTTKIELDGVNLDKGVTKVIFEQDGGIIAKVEIHMEAEVRIEARAKGDVKRLFDPYTGEELIAFSKLLAVKGFLREIIASEIDSDPLGIGAQSAAEKIARQALEVLCRG